MPAVARSKRLNPLVCVVMQRPECDVRAMGPGVGDHASPESSSRM